MTTSKAGRRWPWFLLAGITAVIACGLAFTRQSSCPDPGECTTTLLGGSFGIIGVVACVVTAAWSLRRAIGRRP